MSSSTEERPDHLQRTADSDRQKNLTDAVVTEMVQLSPTVKGLTLKLSEKCSFKAGQWVDFFIDGVDIFTGYSMVSSPHLMNKNSTLELAIKLSDYPPTEWVHKQCKVGSQVKVRVGGDFFYDPQPKDESHNLLLLAGGVGINPLLSSMRHAFQLKQQYKEAPAPHIPGKVSLLYSAATVEELVFKDQIDELCTKCSDFSTTYHVTKETPTENTYKDKRIDSDALVEALSSLKGNSSEWITQCYICGPGPMIDNIESCLTELGVPKENIHYEKWW